jgi:hypothetical protein
VVVDPGTDNSVGRLKEKYTWFRDKYWLRCNEVAPVGAIIVTFDFKPVPKLTWKTMLNPLVVNFIGYYTGTHATPSAPKLQIYDHIGTDWEDVPGGVLDTERSAEEWITATIPQADKYWAAADDNVRIRVFHPNVAGMAEHELNINHVGLAIGGVTTTTSTTSTTSTTTTV